MSTVDFFDFISILYLVYFLKYMNDTIDKPIYKRNKCRVWIIN